MIQASPLEKQELEIIKILQNSLLKKTCKKKLHSGQTEFLESYQDTKQRQICKQEKPRGSRKAEQQQFFVGFDTGEEAYLFFFFFCFN